MWISKWHNLSPLLYNGNITHRYIYKYVIYLIYMEENMEIEEPSVLVRKTKLQYNGRQFTFSMPIDIVDALDIVKGDVLTISVPLDNKKDYSIKLDKYDGK